MNQNQFAEQLAKFENTYPKDRFIILSPFEILGDFMEKVFTISPVVLDFSPNPEDGDMYWIDYPLWETQYKSGGKIYKKRSAYKPRKNSKCVDKGSVAFHGAPLQLMANKSGIRWLANRRDLGTGRLDDGMDPNVIMFAAGGNLLGLTGMQPIIKTHRTDLNLAKEIKVNELMNDDDDKTWNVGGKKMPWNEIPEDLKRKLAIQRAQISILKQRRFALEKAETKAQNRVIRSLLNIKSKYKVDELYYKDENGNHVPKKWVLLVIKFDPKPETEREKNLFLTSLTGTFIEAYPTMANELPDSEPDKFFLPAGSDDEGSAEQGVVDVGAEDVDNGPAVDGGNEAESEPEGTGKQPSGDEDPADLPPLYDTEKKPFIAMFHNTLKQKDVPELLEIISESAADYDMKHDPLEIKPLLDSNERDKIEYAVLKIFINNVDSINRNR